MDAAGMTGADWAAWRAFWKAVYALPLSADELAIFQRHTRCEAPPRTPVDEAWLVVGRGAGKTRMASLHAVFRAITFDHTTVAPGESVVIPLLASDREQAGAALKYVRGFNALPAVAPYVARGDLAHKAEYRTGVDISITTATFKAPRGRTAPTACLDEIAFWNDEGANPDHEGVLAVRGTLGRVPGSLLLVLSNPFAPRGELHKAHEEYFGSEARTASDGVLVWNASTLAMRPSHPPRPIMRLWKADPVKAASEYGADGSVQFRQGDAALFDEAPVSAAIVSGSRERPPVSGTLYHAFVDAAEGARSGDSMTVGIAHREGGRGVLDVVREVEPPFKPGHVIVAEFAPVLHAYGIRAICGDRHAAGFVGDAFEGVGITFTPSPLDKSALYLELLSLVNTGVVVLLDQPRLRGQLLALERRGRDVIDHPRGGHDDVANVAAGALVTALGIGAKKRVQVVFSGAERAGNAPRDRHAELHALIRATKAAAEAEARADWARERATAHEPMTAAPVWHVHQQP